MHRLGAIGRNAVGLPGFDQPLPQRRPVIGRDVDLVAQLAGKADPEDPHREAGDIGLAHAHERKGGAVEREPGGERGQHFAGARPDQGRIRPLFRHRGAKHL